jgi:hypothetical protein
LVKILLWIGFCFGFSLQKIIVSSPRNNDS